MNATYEVTSSNNWRETRARWAQSREANATGQFQTLPWLDAWYAAYADQGEPCLIDVMQGDALAVRLAMTITRRCGQRVLEFADLNVSDFNAPILGRAAPETKATATALWHAVTATLPEVDLIDLRKMPLTVGDRPNPMALLNGLATSPMTGHVISIADWATYHSTLDRHVRMEFERCWRVFQRKTDTRFVRIRDAAQALEVLDVMDHQQRARMAEIGQPFLLDRPAESALYRHDLAGRLERGDVIMTALMAGRDIVAAQYAISDGKTPAVVRISNAGRAWSSVSPGRLIVYQTMKHLAEEGYHHFDLSIGDYDYKRRLGPTKTQLRELVVATTWRGRSSALRHRAVDTLRRHPRLEMRLRALLGKSDPATGRVPELKKGGA
jgi:CelD/BcsL family acetyltransferase involved in cellulose biosynthesis